MTEREKACLGCTLPICDDRSKECRFVQITRVDRREYFAERYQREREKRAEYYRANRERILAAERERRLKKRPPSRHQRYYERHRQDPEWIAKHRAANKEASRRYRSRKRSESSSRRLSSSGAGVETASP